jgi:hypothetical protein
MPMEKPARTTVIGPGDTVRLPPDPDAVTEWLQEDAECTPAERVHILEALSDLCEATRLLRGREQ